MIELQYKPKAFYLLDDTTPFQDYSGYNRTATRSGANSTGIAVSAQAALSARFSLASYGTFEAPVFQAGTESQDFSISACFYPALNAASAPDEQRIISHDSALDGLTIKGTTVYFTTIYSSTGQARCSYDLGQYRKANIIGVHTKLKNQLYVDGQLVSEVDISPEQQEDTYSISDSDFVSGNVTNDVRILLNNLGFYGHALQPEDINAIYRHNSRYSEGEVSKMYGGEDILVSQTARPPYMTYIFDENEDWDAGIYFNTVSDGGDLWSQKAADETTLGGFWMGTVDLYEGATPTTINSVFLWWEGTGETVEVSTDGESWSAATKGTNVSVITPGFNPTDKALHIRVTFASGLDDAYISNLEVNGFLTNTGTYGNRTITYPNGAVTWDNNDPTSLTSTTGVDLPSNGTLTISTDTISSTPASIKTVEVWMRRTGGSSPTYSSNLSGATQYGLGSAGTLAVRGEWYIMHFTSSTNMTGNITITCASPITIGKVAVYPTELSQSEINAVIKSYTGINTIRENDVTVLQVTEPASSVDIYAHDWEILTT